MVIQVHCCALPIPAGAKHDVHLSFITCHCCRHKHYPNVTYAEGPPPLGKAFAIRIGNAVPVNHAHLVILEWQQSGIWQLFVLYSGQHLVQHRSRSV